MNITYNISYIKRCIAVLLLFIIVMPVMSAQTPDKLIFAAEIIRHGDRTPYASLPTAPYHWFNGLGELTAEGMRQEFELGQKFRQIYINQTGLLPKNYQANAIYVRSSNFNRTLTSAQSVLLGLYPLGTGPKLSDNTYALPKGFQPIPIHTIDVDQDDLLVAHDTKRTKFNEIVNHTVHQAKRWQDENQQLTNKFTQWSTALAMPINNLDDLIPIGDNLYVRQLHHAPIPKQLSQQDIKQIIYWSALVQAEQFQPKTIGALTGKDLLVQLNQYMLKKIKQTSEQSPNFVLYSGHDVTVMAILSALGAPASSNPPYASHVSIRLYQTNTNDQNKIYYFTVSLNDQSLSIPACNKTNRCSLAQLATIIDQLNTIEAN